MRHLNNDILDTIAEIAKKIRNVNTSSIIQENIKLQLCFLNRLNTKIILCYA